MEEQWKKRVGEEELVKFEKAKKDEKWVNAMKEELKMIKKMKLRS